MYGVYIYIHTYTNLYHYIEDFCSFMQASFYNRSIGFIKFVDFPDCVGRFWKIFLQRKDLELVIRSPASRFCDGGPWPSVWSSVRLTCLALSCVLLSGAMHRGIVECNCNLCSGQITQQLHLLRSQRLTSHCDKTEMFADLWFWGYVLVPPAGCFSATSRWYDDQVWHVLKCVSFYRCWMPPKICLNTELHDELKRTLRSYRLSFTPGALRDYMSVSTSLRLTPCSSRWLDESWWLCGAQIRSDGPLLEMDDSTDCVHAMEYIKTESIWINAHHETHEPSLLVQKFPTCWYKHRFGGVPTVELPGGTQQEWGNLHQLDASEMSRFSQQIWSMSMHAWFWLGVFNHFHEVTTLLKSTAPGCISIPTRHVVLVCLSVLTALNMSGPVWRSSALQAVSDGLRSGSSRIVKVVETSFQLAVRVCSIGVSGLAYASKLLLWQHPLWTQYDWKILFVKRLERMNFMDPLKLDAKTKTRDKLIEKYTSIKGSGSLKDERLNWDFNFSFQVKLHGGAPRQRDVLVVKMPLTTLWRFWRWCILLCWGVMLKYSGVRNFTSCVHLALLKSLD